MFFLRCSASEQNCAPQPRSSQRKADCLFKSSPKICSSHESLAYWGLLCGASQIPSSSQLNKAKLLLRASKGLRGRQTIEASRSAWAAF